MNIKDIAKAAGVSPSTVSKVINQKDANISEETRRRVLQVIKDSNYIPYDGIREKLLSQNNRIALVLPSLKDPFFTVFADHACELAQGRNFSLTIYSYNGNQDLERKILSELSESYIAGVLYFPQNESFLSDLGPEKSNIQAAVLLDCSFPNVRFPQISRDFTGAAEVCTTYLIRNGRRRISLVSGENTPEFILKKTLSGYKSALSAASISCDDRLILTAGVFPDSGFSSLMDTGIDAVLCQNSTIAGEICRIISERKYKIPADISIISLEDSTFMEQLSPAVSAARSDAPEMARLAFEALTSQINGGQVLPFVTNAPVRYIWRESVKQQSKPRHKIVIAGSINMDITLKVPGLPHSGETVLASAQSFWSGGKGANQAIGVSRFGADAFMIGRLGNDVYGKQLFEQLSREHVDMSGVTFSRSQLSGTAFINVQNDGLNTIVVNPGANASVTPEYIESRREIFNDARYCLIQMEIPFSSVERIIQICKEKQIRVILKPSPAQKLPDHILKDLFLLVPNRDEMNILVPGLASPEEQAEYMLSQGVENIIVTLAEKGCIFVDRLGVKSFPAVDFPSVDTTGASDIFISCLAAQLAKNSEMDDAIKKATIAASYSVSKEGVQNAIISSDLLEDLYRGNFSISPGL